jgi:hypothetical protein
VESDQREKGIERTNAAPWLIRGCIPQTGWGLTEDEVPDRQRLKCLRGDAVRWGELGGEEVADERDVNVDRILGESTFLAQVLFLAPQ